MYSFNVVSKFLILIFEGNDDIRKILTGYSYSPIWGGGGRKRGIRAQKLFTQNKIRRNKYDQIISTY